MAGLGPFTQVNVPIVGTDNYDFMMQGVANLVANQESANYGPNYHARSDEFGQADRGSFASTRRCGGGDVGLRDSST